MDCEIEWDLVDQYDLDLDLIPEAPEQHPEAIELFELFKKQDHKTEIILVASSEIYDIFQAFGFTGAWTYDAWCPDALKTFQEITGLPVDSEEYRSGRIIKPVDFQELSQWRCVSETARYLDMYRLREWLRLVILFNLDMAVI